MESEHIKFISTVSRKVDELAINVLRSEGSATRSTIWPINAPSGQKLELVNSISAASYKIQSNLHKLMTSSPN